MSASAALLSISLTNASSHAHNESVINLTNYKSAYKKSRIYVVHIVVCVCVCVSMSAICASVCLWNRVNSWPPPALTVEPNFN